MAAKKKNIKKSPIKKAGKGKKKAAKKAVKATKKKVAKKATKKKAVKKKTAKKKVIKKKVTKKATKKKSSAKKATKKVAKKAAKKSVSKKTVVKSKTKKKPVAKKITESISAKATETLKPELESQVTIGAKVPSFGLPATGDQVITSDGLYGKKVILFFYPKDDTPGCTIEGHDFTRLEKSFNERNTLVYGISRDTIKSHCSFKEKQNYTVELISDENEVLCGIFGVVKPKNMYGKMVRGIERSTFVLNEKGELIKEWRKVSVPGHADEVLEFIKSL